MILYNSNFFFWLRWVFHILQKNVNFLFLGTRKACHVLRGNRFNISKLVTTRLGSEFERTSRDRNFPSVIARATSATSKNPSPSWNQPARGDFSGVVFLPINYPTLHSSLASWHLKICHSVYREAEKVKRTDSGNHSAVNPNWSSRWCSIFSGSPSGNVSDFRMASRNSPGKSWTLFFNICIKTVPQVDNSPGKSEKDIWSTCSVNPTRAKATSKTVWKIRNNIY